MVEDGKAPEASGSAPRSARGCWSRWDVPGKCSVAPVGARLLPVSPAGAEGSPSPAPSLPSLVSPSCQETSLPIPSSGPRRGGREVARGFLALTLEPPFSVLSSRAFTPGLSHLWPQNPSGCRSPSPGASQREGLDSFPPKALGCAGSSPQPHALPLHGSPFATALPRASSTFGGIPGSGLAPTLLFMAWAYSLLFSRCRNLGALCLATFWGAMARVCGLRGAPPPAPLQGCWPPAGGWARGWDGGGLLSASVTCNHFCIN